MKKLKFILLIVLAILYVQIGFAQQKSVSNPDNEIKQLKAAVTNLEKSLQDKDSKLKEIKKEVVFLTTQNREQIAKLDNVESKLDSIKSTLATAIDGVNKSLGTKIDATSVQVSENKKTADKGFHAVLVYGVSGLFLAIIIVIVVYYMLRRRIGKGDIDISAVKEANKKLEEQSIALDNKLAEVLERQLKTDENVKNISNTGGSETDHSLVLSIANELMRIEQNLSFMDPKTKGVSQLRNRAAAIAASLSSKGYEVPNLVNTEYKEGMNFEAVMEEDEDMEPGIMRIKRVTQPCVMYQGKMIQTAKVVVSYNPDGAE